MRHAAFHPGGTLRLPRHLHDVGDRVVGPAVVGLDLEGVPPMASAAAVVAAFLVAERLHDEAIAGRLPRPGRERPGDAAAQILAVAEVEVGRVADLQGQRVPQVIDEETVEPLSHALPVAGEPGGQRRRPRPLAVVGAIAEVAQRQQRRLDLALHALFHMVTITAARGTWPMTKSRSAASTPSMVATGSPR